MKPVAVIYAPWHSVEHRLLSAAVTVDMEVAASASLPAFSSTLYRDPDAIGMLWAQGYVSAAETVRRMRIGNVKNKVIVLLHELPPFPDHIPAIVEVLAAGADDCQPADIHVDELSQRLLALTRRGEYRDHQNIEFLNCRFDGETGCIESETERVHLQPKEAKVLVHLFRHADECRSKQQLMDELYGGEDEPELKIVDVFIYKLRRKIMKATGGLDCIETVWGRGYRFVPDSFEPETMPMRIHRARASA